MGRCGFDSDMEWAGHQAEHVRLRGNELKQGGRAVMWVGMQFGKASQTSADTHVYKLSSFSLSSFVSVFSRSAHTFKAYIQFIATSTLRYTDLTLPPAAM